MLNCVVAAVLYERFPSIPEGALSRVRASLVDRDTLARLARKLRIGEEMRLGEAMLRSGGEHPAVAADALEAIFGAVFIDAGFDAARSVVERVYAVEFQQVDPATLAKDPKTRLQEWLQARRIPVPQYALTAVTGEAHAQTLTVECRIPELEIAVTASGPSRRVAEQAAAERAYAAATDRDGTGGRG